MSQSVAHSFILNEKEDSPFQWRWMERCFSYYLLSSLVVGCAFWLYQFYTLDFKLHSHLFLPSLFLVCTFLSYEQSAVIYAIKKGKQFLEMILFSQLLALLLMGITQASVGPMVMALIPFGILMLWSFVLWHDQWKTLSMHFVLLVSLVGVLTGIFMKMNSTQEGTLMFAFAFMWLTLSLQSFLTAVRGLGPLRFENTSNTKKDQYFFHDCINHLVGIKLFLSTRSEVKKQDMNLLLREVDLFESLFCDHFKLGHRNLNLRHQFIACKDVPELFEMLMESFLVPRAIAYECHVDSLHPWEQQQLPLAALQRIGSNLIKNAVDHGGEKVIVTLSRSPENSQTMILKVVTQLQSPLSTSTQLEHELSRRILSSHSPRETLSSKHSIHGLGLDSVTTLLEELGGEMSLEITGREWINHLKIPVQNPAVVLKKAA